MWKDISKNLCYFWWKLYIESKGCFLVEQRNWKAYEKCRCERGQSVCREAEIRSLIVNPESRGGEEPVKELVKRDISFQSINFSTLFINVDLTCPATWCWWCSSWCPPWSGSSRRPRRCAATSVLAKVQSGPDGGGTMRLQKTESHR